MKIEKTIKELKELRTLFFTIKFCNLIDYTEPLKTAINELERLDTRKDLISMCNQKREEIRELKEEIRNQEVKMQIAHQLHNQEIENFQHIILIKEAKIDRLEQKMKNLK